ncbi:MAG: 4-hydroxythreonine-4-phosphate dehydrogenase PdxA [Okeania sp. SIO2C9]|uniref:4-hydroxythreonine-4-phosphate dehydrogenase PdxA n=1 Tax=Okeania sp. SIO2C9 TaxID=2607791 RepID=UPI0013BF5FB6|nr:4-hydroxythreonine-4-phosphate dehydrogenase PdxA [Okeania sp. SIO2C9]NEQ73128.1 4-hydroxythreonine-4-phosphate dehydrogenase PdxA [Okeania sp. SIO2C9]
MKISATEIENTNPRLALTIGDPGGIGPEIILKALADPTVTENCDLTIIGSHRILQQTYQKLSQLSKKTQSPELLVNWENLKILDVEFNGKLENIFPGKGNAVSGEASFCFMETAIAQTLAGKFQGIVTAPISKTCWQMAGHKYPGQTELLAEKAGVKKFGMLFFARSPHSNFVLRSLLATTHIPLCQVPKALTPELLSWKLELLIESLQKDFGISQPKIAVAGLNPHSGENGQLGTEEQDWLIPWLDKERDRQPDIQLDGPVPPDTMWVKPGQAWLGLPAKTYDAYLALYHDQGLIPVKLMAFDLAVNTTVGLPFVRTSPDHGTAFDIAGQGIADATSMKAAIKLAKELILQRSYS